MPLTKLEKQVQRVIDQLLVDISHTPGGYAWLQGLPPNGRSSTGALRLRWRRTVVGVVYTERFHTALVKAALDEGGMVDPRGIALVTWLLAHVYPTPHQLYDAWVAHAAPPPPTPLRQGKENRRHAG